MFSVVIAERRGRAVRLLRYVTMSTATARSLSALSICGVGGGKTFKMHEAVWLCASRASMELVPRAGSNALVWAHTALAFTHSFALVEAQRV